MATPRIDTDFQTITACDSTTDWAAINLGKLALEEDVVKEGTAAISFDAKALGGPKGARYNYGSGLNLVGKHIFFWMWTSDKAFFSTIAAGGIRFYVSDTGGTNWGEWTIGGSDAAWVGGGWRLFAIEVDRDFDFTGGTDPNRSALQYFGVETIWIATASKSSVCIIDIIRYGNLLKIAGGGPSDPITFQDIIDKDEADDTQYGFVANNRAGVFEIAGQLIFEPGPSGTYFRDEAVKLAFNDNPCQKDYHKIKLWATGSAVMDFQLGDVVGTGAASIALGGCSLYPIDDMRHNRFLLDFTHPEIDAARFYGTQIQGASEVRFGWETGTMGSPGSDIAIVSCVFDDTYHVSRDIGADYPLLLLNTIASPSGTGPSLRMFDTIDPIYDQDAWSLVAAFGLSTDNGTGAALDYISVNPFRDVTMLVEGQLWEYVNPLFDVANGENPHILWTVTTGTFQERFDYKNFIGSPAGAPYQNARLYVYDSDISDFQIETESTDVTGSYSDTLLKRHWLNGQTGTASNIFGPFTQRILRFGQSPFESALAVEAPIEQVVTLVNDAGVELSEANADLVSGTVYEHGTGTASNLIAFDNGTVLFSAGDVVVGASSGATGTVRDKTGDAADGTIYIVDRNSIAFQDGENLNVAGAPNATANLTSGTGGLDLDFHWEVRASDESLADMYSWQASKSAKLSPDNWVLEMLRHRTQLMKRSGGNFWTEREDSEGVFISERGAGSIDYFTSDENWQWTPPTTYTITLDTLKSDSEVRIYQNVGGSPGDELAGTESSSTQFQYSYEHGGTDIPVIIVIFHLDWRDIRLIIDLEASDRSIPIVQQTDRVYSNP